MVAPLVEVLLLRVLQRRAAAQPPSPPNRLVSRARRVETLGHVADGTTVLLHRPGSAPEVLPSGRLVWPPLVTRAQPTYVVLTHDPVDVWLRVGPFDTLDDRTVHQVELRLTVSLASSPSELHELLEDDARFRGGGGDDGPDLLDGFGDRLLERLAREVTNRTTDAVRRRTLADLTSSSLGVVLDEALPRTFLGGALDRSALEVVDVDWPTEGRGWPAALVPVPGVVAPAALPGPQG
ncbi:hypothetical protein [Microlunatus flavus]|uniref:SPFH domain / Band 7 family protein n=1 Tax=Microlunatus flavus TaxID=1036181 RepID=A0A1H9DCM6_9ACTN|nr:hypothetical protein [Microlunatus flavus]SEQ11119.1 hypothetical protein SAMN05421756_102497 [Microlunatus flavus]